MAKLNFEVDADLQKLINLRKEVEELKSALKDFDVSTDTKGFDDLNRKYEEATVNFTFFKKLRYKIFQLVF